MEFYKYHGTGNDFILMKSPGEYTMEELSKTVCHRRFGVGADGLMVPENSSLADIKMVYHNSDGSFATMCGNGLRCFARFVYEEDLVDKTSFTVETGDGIKEVSLNVEAGYVTSVKVKMSHEALEIEGHAFDLGRYQYKGEFLHLGVPHLVVPVESLAEKELLTNGPIMEKAPCFEQGTNVNFVRVIHEESIKVDTWERGAGHTYACGTGCCASVYALHKKGVLKKKVEVQVKGGLLEIEVLADDTVYMTGPAIKICKGDYLAAIDAPFML